MVKRNDESQGKSDSNNDIKLKTLMVMSRLCDHSDAYMHAKETITIPNTGTAATLNNVNNVNLNIVFHLVTVQVK